MLFVSQQLFPLPCRVHVRILGNRQCPSSLVRSRFPKTCCVAGSPHVSSQPTFRDRELCPLHDFPHLSAANAAYDPCAHSSMATREEHALHDASEASESPAKRLRVDGPDRSLRCQICNRIYERADHLNRHLDSRERHQIHVNVDDQGLTCIRPEREVLQVRRMSCSL